MNVVNANPGITLNHIKIIIELNRLVKQSVEYKYCRNSVRVDLTCGTAK